MVCAVLRESEERKSPKPGLAKSKVELGILPFKTHLRRRDSRDIRLQRLNKRALPLHPIDPLLAKIFSDRRLYFGSLSLAKCSSRPRRVCCAARRAVCRRSYSGFRALRNPDIKKPCHAFWGFWVKKPYHSPWVKLRKCNG